MSRAGFRLRAASGRQVDLPFALAFFTDARRQADICACLSQFPSAHLAGPVAVIFRHDELPPAEREKTARKAMAIAHAKGHLFLMARKSLPGADGTHGITQSDGIVSMAVHAQDEALKANRSGADLGFVSPVFRTRSHPDAAGLGPADAARLARTLACPAFALGGVTAQNYERLLGGPFVGIGAIGAISD